MALSPCQIAIIFLPFSQLFQVAYDGKSLTNCCLVLQRKMKSIESVAQFLLCDVYVIHWSAHHFLLLWLHRHLHAHVYRSLHVLLLTTS